MSTYRIGLAIATSEVDIKNGPTVGAVDNEQAVAGPKGILWAGVLILGVWTAAKFVLPGSKT